MKEKQTEIPTNEDPNVWDELNEELSHGGADEDGIPF
jgi:hypothetical protein